MELERDIVEFLIAKFEDRAKDAVVNLFLRWIDEHTSADAAKSRPASADRQFRDEGLLQWIDRNAPLIGLTENDLREIGTDIRTLLESIATPTGEFVCR